MRLIDTDKLEAYGTTVPKECNAEDYISGVRDVLEHIDAMPTVDAIPIDFIVEFKEDYCNAKSDKCDIGIANALVELMLCWEDEQEGLEWRNDHERIPSKQQSVDAIPVEWIQNILTAMGDDSPYRPAIKWLLLTYKMEKEE